MDHIEIVGETPKFIKDKIQLDCADFLGRTADKESLEI